MSLWRSACRPTRRFYQAISPPACWTQGRKTTPHRLRTSGGRTHRAVAVWPVSIRNDLRHALVVENERGVAHQTTSNTKREIQVEIPVEEVNRETDALIQKYQKLARIPGFRSGHVPASVIRQRFSEDLKSEVVEALVPRYFRKEAEKQGLIPVSQPRVTDLHTERKRAAALQGQL